MTFNKAHVLSPSVRHSIYNLAIKVAGLIAIIVPILAKSGLISPTISITVLSLVALIGGSGVNSIAKAALGRQMQDGTLDFQGSAEDQAVAAIQAVANQVTQANAAAVKVKDAAAAAVNDFPVLGISLAQQALDAIPG